MIKATPSNVGGYCVGWEPPRRSFRLRSQLVQAPMHRDSMSGPRATLREVTIATGNLSPSISSGERIDFDSTRHRAALRPNKSPATGGGAQIYYVLSPKGRALRRKVVPSWSSVGKPANLQTCRSSIAKPAAT
jgi:hypothetical protein